MKELWAGIGEKMLIELSQRVPLEQLPWNGGDLDIKKFVDTYICGLKETRDFKDSRGYSCFFICNCKDHAYHSNCDKSCGCKLDRDAIRNE